MLLSLSTDCLLNICSYKYLSFVYINRVSMTCKKLKIMIDKIFDGT